MKSQLFAFAIVALFSVSTAFAQVKIKDSSVVGTLMPAPGALLDLESATKGLLIPRIALVNDTSAAPLTAHAAGMLVYNTAAAGVVPHSVAPGFYFNDGAEWMKVTQAFPNTDTTNDGFRNNVDLAGVELATRSDGTARAAGTGFMIKDNGKFGFGTSSPSAHFQFGDSIFSAGNNLTVNAGAGNFYAASLQGGMELFENGSGYYPSLWMATANQGPSGGAELAQTAGTFSLTYWTRDLTNPNAYYRGPVFGLRLDDPAQPLSGRFIMNTKGDYLDHNLIFDKDGNLGLGDDFLPTEKLDVEGNARIRNSAIIGAPFPSYSSGLSTAASGSDHAAAAIKGYTEIYPLNPAGSNRWEGNSEIWFQKEKDDVNVGVLSHAHTNNRMEIGVGVNPSTSFPTLAGFAAQGTTNENSFATINASGVEKVRVDNNGNMGIGTITPTSKLQVVGIPAYDNEAAAATAGLTSGAIWQTSSTNTLGLPAGMLMVKQ